MKKKLCLSFSMGETSAFMTQWCMENLQDEYEMVVVCANTGEEDEESLIFGNRCDNHFGWNMVWVEAKVDPNFGNGIRANVKTFETLSRNGEPFEAVIAKYGIPNKNFPHCSRALKEHTIRSYVKEYLGWNDYETAIGIRIDEPHRLHWEKAKANKIIYPLATHIRMDKPRINHYWNSQKFRLHIKSYCGNCKACWKKSKRKLMTIAIERPEYFDFTKKMEVKYGFYIPEHRPSNIELPITFFRMEDTVEDIFEESKIPFTHAIDERKNTAIQYDIWEQYLDENDGCVESCEAF